MKAALILSSSLNLKKTHYAEYLANFNVMYMYFIFFYPGLWWRKINCDTKKLQRKENYIYQPCVFILILNC